MSNSFRIIRFEELPSTQTYAKEQFLAGNLKANDIILSAIQTSGRGRYDRKWVSPKGNIYMTLALEPSVPHEKWAQISYLIAVSISEAVLFIDNCLDISHKWVNDLLLDDKKFSGILLENLQNKMLLVGMGVNIVHSNEMDKLNATALSPHSNQIEYELLLKTILDRIEANYETFLNFGFTPIKNLWLKRAYKLNDNITVRFRDKEQYGRFIGIDDSGMLQLFDKDKISLISAGEVYFG